jgi:hypothetical protein
MAIFGARFSIHGLFRLRPASRDISPFRMLASFYDRSFAQYAKRTVEDVIIEDLIAINRPNQSKDAVLRSAKAVHAALPIRLAQRILDIHQLPYGLGVNSAIQVRLMHRILVSA